MKIAIAGQSNASYLRRHFLDAPIGPMADVWVVARGGSALRLFSGLPPRDWWLSGNIDGLLSLLIGTNPDLVWWIQGESEALHGTTEQQYIDAFLEMRRELPAKVRFMISPIAAWSKEYHFKEEVRAAQRYLARLPGNYPGPEFIDLPNDGVHLTPAGRKTFAERGAAWAAQLMELA